jgi:LPS sulfotransferase NodH
LHPHTSYFICTTPRSGSSLLCNRLTNTQIAGNPDEYFGKESESWIEKWGPDISFREYLNRVLQQGTTANGVFGAKVFLIDGYGDECLFDFIRKAAQLPEYAGAQLNAQELLADIFPNLHYIWLTRRDKVRQAVSLWRALQTRVWLSFRTMENVAPQPAFYDAAKIHRALQYLLMQNAEWQEFFTRAAITPLTVVYEDFVGEQEQTISRVLDFLGIERPDTLRLYKPFLMKQADSESEEWVRRYHEDSRNGMHRKGRVLV